MSLSPAVIEILLSSALFLVLWGFLGNYVFKPFFALHALREARTTGDRKKAQELKKESQNILEKIETELYQTRLQGIRSRDQKLAETKSKAQKILDEETEKATEKLELAREEIQTLKIQARKQIEEEAKQLAKVFVNKVMLETPSKMVH